MLKILADHCVHTDLIEALRMPNIKVVRASELGLAKASDNKIFDYAKKRGFVLLSFDKDFGNFSIFDPTGTSGIVIIYIERMSKEQIIKETVSFFKKTTAHSLQDKLSIIELKRVRNIGFSKRK